MKIDEIMVLPAVLGAMRARQAHVTKVNVGNACELLRDRGRKDGMPSLDYNDIARFAKRIGGGLPDHVPELYKAYRDGCEESQT